jgi:Rps23 Pro-64 3,4-dihydroxylase Tpa1-like proline 4-hydroxylase
MSFFLNDDYEGGEIEFTRFGLSIKPKANQAVFFPSNYVYSHSVNSVVSGVRYSIVGWWE